MTHAESPHTNATLPAAVRPTMATFSAGLTLNVTSRRTSGRSSRYRMDTFSSDNRPADGQSWNDHARVLRQRSELRRQCSTRHQHVPKTHLTRDHISALVRLRR